MSSRSFLSSSSYLLSVCSAGIILLAEPPGDVIFCLSLLGRGKELCGLAELYQFTQVEESRAVGYTGCLLHVVRNDDDREVVFKLVDQPFDSGGGNRIQ